MGTTRKTILITHNDQICADCDNYIKSGMYCWLNALPSQDNKCSVFAKIKIDALVKLDSPIFNGEKENENV